MLDCILNFILSDYLVHSPIKTVIALDASQHEEKFEIAIFASNVDWSLSLHIPDFVPSFVAVFFAKFKFSAN